MYNSKKRLAAPNNIRGTSPVESDATRLPITINSDIVRKNPLKIYYCNARSFLPKMDKLKKVIDEIFPSIICVTETWLNDMTPTAAINIPTYNSYRLDHKCDNPSGGLALYVHNSINSSLMVLDDVKTCDGFEYLAVTIQVNHNRKFILGLLYNHPPVNLEIFESNCSLIEKLISTDKNFYLCGDYNLNLLKTEKSSISRKFSAFLNRLNLFQCVNFPTRIATIDGIVVQSMIDLFITNSRDSVLEIEHNENLQMADHRDLIITLCMNIKVPKKTFMHTYRDKTNYSKSNFCTELVLSGITKSATCTDNINYASEIFNQCFMSVLNMTCPSKTIRCKYDFGLKFNPELDFAFNQKSKLLKKISKTPEKAELSIELLTLINPLINYLQIPRKLILMQNFRSIRRTPKNCGAASTM